VALLATAMLLAGTSRDADMTTDAEEISVSQTANCVRAINLNHVSQGRASAFLLWVWARGSNTYIGWIFATTSLQEGPTGTWTMVPQCGPGGSSSTSSSSTSSSTSSSSTSSSTTSSSTTSSSVPAPDGAAIYAARCASCHGPNGEGGAGPALGGVVDGHGRDYVVQTVTNGRPPAMPAWGGILTPAEIQAVVDYVATFEGSGHHGHHGSH
jgi:cytochrome c5